MNTLNSLRDKIHPGAKLFMDDGSAATVEEAVARLETFRIGVVMGTCNQSDGDLQNCLLTLVNAGVRTFLGGVFVAGLDRTTIATTKLSSGPLLVEEIERLGARVVDKIPPGAPIVLLGGEDAAASDAPIVVRPIWKGWCAGVVPADEVPPFLPSDCLSVAPVAAAGLALAECFDAIRGANPMAGQRHVGVNLLEPGSPWKSGQTFGGVVLLPQAVWLLGVGHLGQAYLWNLATLPYPDGQEARMTLQDFDRIAERNMGTSLLCMKDSVGAMKTRTVAAWAELRRFQVTIVERGFGADFQLTSNDPKLMLCGVDNASTRQVLEDPGFTLTLEAGVGAGIRDFTKFRCHAFDGSGRAKQVFRNESTSTAALTDLPAYRDLKAKLGDECGVVTVAGSAIGVPFVGAFVGAIVVAESVKVASGGFPSFVSYGNVAEANGIQRVPFEDERRFSVGSVRPKGLRVMDGDALK